MWQISVKLTDKECIALVGRLQELSEKVVDALETNLECPVNVKICAEYQALTKILKGNGKYEIEK
jgi:uncharacterized Fe-S cluster-containing radical SAM superfamily enzyme